MSSDATRRLRRREVSVDRDRALTRAQVEELLGRKNLRGPGEDALDVAVRKCGTVG